MTYFCQERSAVLTELRSVIADCSRIIAYVISDGNEDEARDMHVSLVCLHARVVNLVQDDNTLEDECCALRNQFEVVHVLVDNYKDNGNYEYIAAIVKAIDNCSGAFISE